MSIFNHFRHLNLSQGQETAITKLEAFLASPTQVFMLKGYAGSGKTTILKGLISYLGEIDKKFVLIAPTGRAAKVLRDKAGRGVTIHKAIYNFDKLQSINEFSDDAADHSFHYYFPINKTEAEQRIIIIDEASMISSKEAKNELFTFGTNVLLNDLLTYASLHTTNNKLIFVGDPAQLPPVGDSDSLALVKPYFVNLGFSCDETEMKQVLRQSDNLILKNAETLRITLEQEKRPSLIFDYDAISFFKIEGNQIIEKYTELFPQPIIGNGVIISFSNSQCFHYNVAIREKLFPNQHEVVAGDLLLINNNNYHTYGAELFNGDIAKVIAVDSAIVSQSAPVWCDEDGKKVRKVITLNFRKIIIRIPSHQDDIVCNIIDSHLHSVNRDLTLHEMKALYINFVIRFTEGNKNHKVGSEAFKQALKADPFFNALKVKFGYAITCHKAQGGEWDKVFVDYYGRVSLKTDPLRWCYTATTRGVNAVYAINAPHFGRMANFKFSKVGTIGTLPNDALQLSSITQSQFHTTNHHKCKSRKYWEIVEKLENTNYKIEKVETFGYLERYTIKNEQETFQLQASHRNSGHFIEKFNFLIAPTDIVVKQELETLFNTHSGGSYHYTYCPGAAFLGELFSMMQAECSNLDITITNVLEGQSFVTYYLITDAVCSYIQFYFNKQEQLTTAMPKTFGCSIDFKMDLLIQNILNHAS